MSKSLHEEQSYTDSSLATKKKDVMIIKATLTLSYFYGINNMGKHSREPKLPEIFHFSAFCNMLDPILRTTGLHIKEGETVSSATKRMQIVNDVDVTYGRRIDALLACESVTDDGDDVELTSIEFKRSDCSTATLQQQQNKNLRISACILNDIHLATNNAAAKVIYLDCAGRSAYSAQLVRFEDCYVGHKIGQVRLISSLFELKQFKKTIQNLYTWRENMIKIGNEVALAQAQHSFDYDLIETSDFAASSATTSPKRKVPPMSVFLLPSNRSKRNRSATH
ncbi:hypothetical protein MBANPS3_009176 [Mucor bainieri]